MRKVLAFICYGIMLTANGAAGYFTYRAYDQSLSYEYGILLFVISFIISYWFATFFNQLIAPKSGLLIGRRLYNVLYWLSTAMSAALIGIWVYLFFSRALYNGFDNSEFE